ncbi:MAG: FMN-binding protein [Elusimicrobiota bacterium]
MKKIIFICVFVIALSSILIVVYNNQINLNQERNINEPAPKQGKYIGIGQGFVDEIVIEVTFKKIPPGNRPGITEIKIIESNEVEKYWNPVKNELIDKVIRKQTTEVDGITGATASSRGLLEAINDAREKAYIGK